MIDAKSLRRLKNANLIAFLFFLMLVFVDFFFGITMGVTNYLNIGALSILFFSFIMLGEIIRSRAILISRFEELEEKIEAVKSEERLV